MEEMLTVNGKYWKVPAGETPAKYGKGVENGILRSVGVVPKPLQKPYPVKGFRTPASRCVRGCTAAGV